MHPKPNTANQPLSKIHEQEDRLLKLQQMIEVMGQKTAYFGKILELIISERIKTTKLTDNIEHLQNENDTLKARFSSQGNERHTSPPLQTTNLTNKPEELQQENFALKRKATYIYGKGTREPEPFYPSTPNPHTSIIEPIHNYMPQTPPEPTHQGNNKHVNEHNRHLKHETEELKIQLANQKLECENKNFQKELLDIKEKLKLSKQQDVVTKKDDINKSKATQNKQVVIVGNSMLNNIEEKYNLNTRNASVTLRPFSGSTVEDLKGYVTPIAKKHPDIIITRVGTNNVRSDSPTQIVEKLIKPHDHIKTITPGS